MRQTGHSRLILPSLRTRSARQAATFFWSRVVNGALALLQVYLVTRAIGPSQAGRFFLLWTAAWVLSVVFTFGTDGILPRAVAEATVAGRRAVSVRSVLATGLVSGLVILPLLMLVLGVPPAGYLLGLALGLTWAGILLLGSLLKAHGRADLAGVTTNVLWPLGPACVPLLLLAGGGTWIGLGVLTLAASMLALAATVLVAARALGAEPLLGLADRKAKAVPVERDEVGAAVLTSLYAFGVYLPVVLAALVGVGPAAAAGIFAATRVAGPFSWGYQAVTAVLTPRIAENSAWRDVAGLRRTLIRGGVAGAILTWPGCVVGILLAGPLLSLLDSSYAAYSDVLAILIAARGLDAATGPLGEALLVGRRTWLDVRLVVAGIVAGTVLTLVLYDPVGTLAIGLGAGGAFVITNLLRVGVFVRILGRPRVEMTGFPR